MRKTAFFLFLFLIGYSALRAQDIHFTQYYTAPLTINPASTGDYSGDFRVMNTFRSQWRKFDPGYLTNSLGYDQQIYILNERFSGGLNVVYDKSGINAFQVAKINVSMAWHKIVNKHVFHAGIQGGYIMKSYDVSKLTFPDQFNHDIGYFDNTLVTGDADINDHISYMDLNAGFGWHRKFGKHTPKIGYGIYHLNRPNESFYGNKNKLPIRHGVTLSDKWEIRNNRYITPNVMYLEQVKSNDLLMGLIITRMSDEQQAKIKSLSYGAAIRNSIHSKTDAVALIGGFRYNQFDFGLSYDINISDVKTVTKNHGAFEISIIYMALNSRAVKVRIPCERY